MNTLRRARVLRSLRAMTLRHTSIPCRQLATTRTLAAKNPNNPNGPPKHEMQYFPQMVNALPSESGEFRRVLWTGLYSQVVLMTVPIGGDIGDEVSWRFSR